MGRAARRFIGMPSLFSLRSVMSDRHENLPYTIVCETHDAAVVFCLRALCEFADGRSDLAPPTAAPSGAWSTSGGSLTFRFGDGRNRALFLGEATRLLPGKWVRLAMTDGENA